jgi:hypothetical protein
MARYTISVTATIEATSLIEGRCDAERMVELLTSEFLSVAYNVELREPSLGNTIFEESAGGEPVTYH